ncbi:MAG: NifB/NifX family molybdenum-iron cluster-binding protein [Planctomycetota bacterium]|nr:NifB/NifX family molybdenum-iron cluster-binding protein [Planctomycetota bacterium]
MSPGPTPSGTQLGIWRLRVAAAPHPLVLRRDTPFDAEAPVVDVPDVLRYVATARAGLRGPLVLEVEGPGDPLASPESVLRILALVREHHPDVLTGLVIDGPLLAEYTEELETFGLGYLVLKVDAATQRTAERLVAGAVYRADRLERSAAATLVLDETHRALGIARQHGFSVAIRTTLVPTVNAHEIERIARESARWGAERMDVVPHVEVPGAPLLRGGTPTEGELEDARDTAADAFAKASRGRLRGPRVTDWISPERCRAVDVDSLEAVDILRTLPDPDGFDEPARLLPRRKAQFVAVASRDGTLVDSTLAGTPLLRIYAVTENHIRCLGTRHLDESILRRHDGVGDSRAFLHAVVGCRAVVATGFSQRAVTLLRAVGIRPVQIGGRVDEVLDRVARGTVKQAT